MVHCFPGHGRMRYGTGSARLRHEKARFHRGLADWCQRAEVDLPVPRGRSHHRRAPQAYTAAARRLPLCPSGDDPPSDPLVAPPCELRAHLADFVSAYNFARRLKTLKGLTPYEYICKAWTKEPERFTLDPLQQMPGLNILEHKFSVLPSGQPSLMVGRELIHRKSLSLPSTCARFAKTAPSHAVADGPPPASSSAMDKWSSDTARLNGRTRPANKLVLMRHNCYAGCTNAPSARSHHVQASGQAGLPNPTWSTLSILDRGRRCEPTTKQGDAF
jgi:hypothetical protein